MGLMGIRTSLLIVAGVSLLGLCAAGLFRRTSYTDEQAVANVLLSKGRAFRQELAAASEMKPAKLTRLLKRWVALGYVDVKWYEVSPQMPSFDGEPGKPAVDERRYLLTRRGREMLSALVDEVED